MRRRQRSFDRTTATVLLCFAALLSVLGLFAYRRAVASFQRGAHEYEVWAQLEERFADPRFCGRYLRGLTKGRPVVHSSSKELRVGESWQGTPWVVKDIYLLGPEEEREWMLLDDESGEYDAARGYLKIELVHLPRGEGESLGINRLISGRTSTRLIPLKLRGEGGRRPASGGELKILECQKTKPHSKSGVHEI